MPVGSPITFPIAPISLTKDRSNIELFLIMLILLPQGQGRSQMECFKRPEATRPAVATAGCAPGSWETVQGRGLQASKLGYKRDGLCLLQVHRDSFPHSKNWITFFIKFRMTLTGLGKTPAIIWAYFKGGFTRMSFICICLHCFCKWPLLPCLKHAGDCRAAFRIWTLCSNILAWFDLISNSIDGMLSQLGLLFL